MARSSIAEANVADDEPCREILYSSVAVDLDRRDIDDHFAFDQARADIDDLIFAVDLPGGAGSHKAGVFHDMGIIDHFKAFLL